MNTQHKKSVQNLAPIWTRYMDMWTAECFLGLSNAQLHIIAEVNTNQLETIQTDWR